MSIRFFFVRDKQIPGLQKRVKNMLLDCIKKLLVRWLQLFVDLQLNVPVYVNILRTSGHDKIGIHCLWNKHKINPQICNKRHSFDTFNGS